MKPFTDDTVKKLTEAIYTLTSEFIMSDEIASIRNVVSIKIKNKIFAITVSESTDVIDWKENYDH